MDHRKQPPKSHGDEEPRGHLLALHLFHPDKPRESVARRIRKPFLLLLLLFLLAFAALSTFFPSRLCRLSGPTSGFLAPATTSLFSADADAPLDLSHLFFGIGSSARTWGSRRRYVELWWRPGEMRGHVWLDKDLPGGPKAWPPSCPSYRISADASRFGPRTSAARIARVVKESYLAALAAPGAEDLRWLVMGDDDTVFFPENLLAVLRRHDHREMLYVGGISESVEQDVFHSYAMAYGGGGFAVSVPAAAELSRVLDRCLLRYSRYYGSDQRIQACLSEVGVPLTRELGFHQMDIRGDPFGLLAAHPIAPLVSLHHLDSVEPVFPGSGNRTEALRRLIAAAQADPSRTLQQTICYEPRLNWSLSVSWGYAVQLHPHVVDPNELQTPLQTFHTWGSRRDGPFTFNTRPVASDPCKRSLVFLLAGVKSDEIGGAAGSLTEYRRAADEGKKEKGCKDKEFHEAEKVRSVRVIAPAMDPYDWRRAPRRQCCEAKTALSRGSMAINVLVRKCRLGETISPP